MFLILRRDSVVVWRLATGCTPRGSNLSEGKISRSAKADPQAHTASCATSTEVTFQGVKQPGRWVDHLPSKPKVKDHLCLRGMLWIKLCLFYT